MDTNAAYLDNTLTLRVSGELDHHAAAAAVARIEEAINTHLPRRCVLDLSGLTFMDSSGIAVILKAHRRVLELGGRLCVANVPPRPRRVLEAAGISRIVQIVEA
ncbi:MAG: anti-sigma factor antagonist [Oscillospiraceae bacterium]|jgi:stage II sporulation protein AA (anti-sigma F factor antagonist)|nr:anti-sigma factor antagonist [Oscillospiraceae bacterium]